jgi:hypothetical protein
MAHSCNCEANGWAPILLAMTRTHDPTLQRRSLNGGFSLYRIAARTLCLRRAHPEPAASRVGVERISAPLHVSNLRTDYKEVIMLPGGICSTQLAPNMQCGSSELESARPPNAGIP